jgi:hypothetical protein
MTFGTFTSSSEHMMAMRRAVGGFIVIAVIPVSVVTGATSGPQEPSKKSIPVCPQEIPLRDITVKWPDGWVGELDTKFALQAVGVIQGAEASHEGDIVPETEKHKDKLVVTYSGLDSFGSRQRWLSCSYGNDSSLRLYRKFPFNIKQCVMKYEESSPNSNFYRIESYRCE